MNGNLAFYLSGSDNVNELGENAIELDGLSASALINNSLSVREQHEPLEDSIKRRMILNPFTNEELRTKLLRDPKTTEDAFMASLAAEAFKTRHIIEALDKLKEATKNTLDWTSIEADCMSNQLEKFRKSIPDNSKAAEIINKIASI